MLTPVELMFRDAWSLAQARRKSVGLPPGEPEVRNLRGGGKAVGPEYYKVTCYLRPWHYADLVHYKQKHDISYGLNKIIEKLIDTDGS